MIAAIYADTVDPRGPKGRWAQGRAARRRKRRARRQGRLRGPSWRQRGWM